MMDRLTGHIEVIKSIPVIAGGMKWNEVIFSLRDCFVRVSLAMTKWFFNSMYTYNLIMILSALLLLVSCHQAVIKVESIPRNTPKGQPLYVAGNFNNWDPGDEAYQMTLNQ